MSLPQRDLILEHVEIIQAEMDDIQPHDPDDWFEAEIEKDQDFQGGRAIGTEATEHGCVFLNEAGRCVLQILTMKDPDLPQLKPFFCRLFPLTVVDGELTYDDHCEGEMVYLHIDPALVSEEDTAMIFDCGARLDDIHPAFVMGEP